MLYIQRVPPLLLQSERTRRDRTFPLTVYADDDVVDFRANHTVRVDAGRLQPEQRQRDQHLHQMPHDYHAGQCLFHVLIGRERNGFQTNYRVPQQRA